MKFPVYTGPLLVALAYCHPVVGANTTDTPPTLQLSTTSEFNFQFLIALTDATTGGADIAPVLGAAKDIKAGDMASFAHQFYKLANATKAQAEDPSNAFGPINVRDTWFSAAQYFRRADFYGHRNWSNPLINKLWEEQTAAFNKGLAALSSPGKRVQIPAKEGNFTIEAIWYSAPDSDDRKLPTLIIGNGFDAAQEDSYHQFVAPALARGWNCITYEGPGQPTVRRNQNIGFIPQWEKVVTPVVDWVFSEKADVVDANSLVLIGNSFGGYLAARAAAFEPRISATVLLGGVWDAYAAFSSQFPSEIIGLYEAGNHTAFDRLIHQLRDNGKLPVTAAWGVDQGLWSFYTHSPSDFLTLSKGFRLKEVVDKMSAPVFVGDAEFENFFQGQPQLVKDALGDKGTLHRFNGVAGYHCQTGAGQELMRTMFAWINKTLNQ
ncbi:unnamed protein product [Penicillium olsonii]|uniref:AB hydrolase-1 domain-containing protein n=1 Tax=Penicillium olsonii TaxID=99116 RepID=A0A9W4HVH9_PENOL|nr:unnamed protein product [Penicillium olsonii]CAG8138991.1 unnamed protein product [Penicillium olsonii]